MTFTPPSMSKGIGISHRQSTTSSMKIVHRHAILPLLCILLSAESFQTGTWIKLYSSPGKGGMRMPSSLRMSSTSASEGVSLKAASPNKPKTSTEKVPSSSVGNVPATVRKQPSFGLRSRSLSTGVAGYLAGLFVATRKATVPLSAAWCASIPLMLLSSYAIARSFQSSEGSLAVTEKAFSRVFAAHVFSATALPLLATMLLPLFESRAQVATFMFSMALMAAGSVAEILAHFRDRWEFVAGCRALEGAENFVFSAGLNGGFSFLAAAFSPTPLHLGLAAAPVLALCLANARMPWKRVKVFNYILQMITAGTANVVLIRKLSSLWPLLYFVQAYNIIHNAGLILKTGNQHLHLMPTVYGWFSYVVPFALAVHESTKSAALPVVAGASLLSVFGAHRLEQFIVKNFRNPDHEPKMARRPAADSRRSPNGPEPELTLPSH